MDLKEGGDENAWKNIDVKQFANCLEGFGGTFPKQIRSNHAYPDAYIHDGHGRLHISIQQLIEPRVSRIDQSGCRL
jgi:hypothetical protein